MYSLPIDENVDFDDILARHNIRISELKKEESMSQPHVKKVIHLPKVRMLGRGRPSSGIRITNVKSIKPPDPEIVKKHEEEKLRKKLHKEIERRSRTCANKSYECSLPVVLGRQYCGVHILQDPAAPYRQCSHAYSNERRCPLPAPLTHHDRRDQGLCFEHAQASLAARQRAAAPPPPVTTTESLLNQLQHYVRPERTRTTSCASSVSVVSDPADQDQGIPAPVDPFKQIDAIGVNRAVCSTLMECGSGSDSDADSVTLGRDGDCRLMRTRTLVLQAAPVPLRHAGVFTAEEAVIEAKNTLRMLQQAYLRQMVRLKTLLHQARYDYVKSLRAEKEQYCSINSQARGGPLTVRERRQLRKLKAYASYHKRHGVDAVLARKQHRKRAKVNDIMTNRPIPSQGRCTFTEYGVRCASAVLPASKHCMKHVVLDRHQVLFTACGDSRGGVSCREPIPRLPPPAALCRYHTDPPSHTVFTLKKENSDSDSETDSASTDSALEDAGSHSIEEPSDILENNLPPDLAHEL